MVESLQWYRVVVEVIDIMCRYLTCERRSCGDVEAGILVILVYLYPALSSTDGSWSCVDDKAPLFVIEELNLGISRFKSLRCWMTPTTLHPSFHDTSRMFWSHSDQRHKDLVLESVEFVRDWAGRRSVTSWLYTNVWAESPSNLRFINSVSEYYKKWLRRSSTKGS